ncbi:MAG: CinA family protein, partial [Roseomonas sp.]|nr:CinA family protein [Roseomonas sp.]
MAGMRSASESYALLLARRVREKHGADWGLAETGAAGPTGNRYGDAAGHSCIAVVGSGVERVITLETGSADRRANMYRFAQGAFGLAIRTVG